MAKQKTPSRRPVRGKRMVAKTTRKVSTTARTTAGTPVRKSSAVRPAVRALPGRTPAFAKLQFASAVSLKRSLGTMRLDADKVKTLLDAAAADSKKHLKQITTALVARRENMAETAAVRIGMVEWAAAARMDENERRAVVIDAFRRERGGMQLIHGISRLPRDNAKVFMKSYFDQGGTMKDVIEWLSQAGKALAEKEAGVPIAAPAPHRLRRSAKAKGKPTAKGWFDDVVDFVKDTVDDVGNAISNVVDAVIDGAKSLGQAIAAAASWTVAQVSDLVRALIRAGKSVAAILTEALNKGLVKKFVQAVLSAGRALSEALVWAAAKVTSVVQDVISAALALGRTIYEVLSWAASQVTTTVQKMLSALVALGKTIKQIMLDAVHLVSTSLRKIVGALYRIGAKIGDILVSVVSMSLSVIRTVIEGLFMIGVFLAQVVESVCLNVAEGFRKGFFQGIMALGYGMLDILKGAATAGVAVLGLAFAVILEIAGGHRPLTAAEKTQARNVFGYSIDLDRVKVAVASLPADLVNYLNNNRPFTTMYVINFASWDHIEMHTLIHELTHVWQAVVAGPVYMVEALHSQLFGRGYDVTDADIAAAAGDIRKLEREQQAVVVERFWMGRYGGFNIDWQKYEPLARGGYRGQMIIVRPTVLTQPVVLAPIRTLNGKRARAKQTNFDIAEV